jgi:hypothetical protein
MEKIDLQIDWDFFTDSIIEGEWNNISSMTTQEMKHINDYGNFSLDDYESHIIKALKNDITMSLYNRINKVDDHNIISLDLRDCDIEIKSKNILDLILSSSQKMVIISNRLSLYLRKHDIFIPILSTSQNRVFEKIGTIFDKEIFVNYLFDWSSNKIISVDGVNLNISDTYLDKRDLGDNIEWRLSTKYKIDFQNLKVLRIFEEGYLDGLESWILENRISKVSGILGEGNKKPNS